MGMKMKKDRESDGGGEKSVIQCFEAVGYVYDLPEGCIADIISLTSPTDACRLSAVSTLFRSVTESDVVWDRFLPTGFEEVAELINVCWFEIRGKIVFKRTIGAYGFESQAVEATVGNVVGEASKRFVYLDPGSGWRSRNHIRPRRVGGPFNRTSFWWQNTVPRETSVCCEIPNKREDGWLEIELGEFFCEEGQVGELGMSVAETSGSDWKAGLIVEGIEIRPKEKLKGAL